MAKNKRQTFGIRTAHPGIREDVLTRMGALGWSPRTIHLASGVGYSSVLRFLKGERDMRTRNADRLIGALDAAEN